MKVRGMLIALLVLMTGCGKEIPKDIIQPDKMEKVLYDYHLAMGMSSNLKSTDKEAYRKFVYQKHHITKEHFDSSMVWYTREAQELAAIYDRLGKRFKKEYSHTEALLESRGGETSRMTLPGDTVNIWNQENLYWLTEAPLLNKLSFDFKPDSNFHPKDDFRWEADFLFMAKGEAIMGLNVVYENDSVMGMTQKVALSGRQTIHLSPDSAYRMKALNGFIYVPEDSTNHPNILVHNITLTRYHNATDSLTSEIPTVDEQPIAPPERKQRPKSR